MSNIVPISLLPEVSEFQMMKELAQMSVKSGLLPTSIKTPEAAMIIMLKGRELGIPAMQAFSHIHVINGKPAMSAELMLTQIYKHIPRVSINYIQSDDKACVIECQRPNSNKVQWSFTIEEAKRAELLSKGPWKQYPAAMLRARAISIMARAQFPDALNGVSYTPEELGAEIELDDQGNEVVKDVTPKPHAKEKQEDAKPIVNHAPQSQAESNKNDVAGTVDLVDKIRQEITARGAKIDGNKPKEPITYKTFVFQNPPEFKGKRFDEIEYAELSGYMDALAFKYLNQDIPLNVQWFFDLYNEYNKSIGIK